MATASEIFLSKAEFAAYEEAFVLIDHDGDGNISTDDLKTFLRQLGQEITDDDVSEMLACFPASNGHVDLRGFISFCVHKPATPATIE
jgi:Ca2+-binding EF-hand superfamily protein